MIEEILFQYQNLLFKLHKVCQKLEKYYAEHLVCKPGCCQCCEVERTVLSLEAYVIEQQLSTLSAQRIKRVRAFHLHDDNNCPMLWKNHCIIYPARPIICRTYGLPILYREAEITFIDYCRLNFTKLPEDYEFENKWILDMNKFNTELIQLDQNYTEQVLMNRWSPDNRTSLKQILNG